MPSKRTVAEALRRTAPYVLRYPWSAAGNIGCALLSLGFSFAFPQVTQFIVDDVIGKGATSQLPMAVLVLLAAYLLRDGFDGLRSFINASFEQNVILDMRRDIHARLQRLPLSFFDRHASGDLITLVMDDVTAVERLIIDGCEMGVTSLLGMLVVVTILAAKNPTLALCAVAPLPALVAGIMCYTRLAHPLFREQRRSGAIVNALIADNLQGMRQVKAFGQEDGEGRRFVFHANSLRHRALSVAALWSVYGPSMNFVASMGTVLVLWIGGPLVTSGQLTLGELIGFIFYLPLFYEPVGRLHRLNQMIQAARASSERLFEVMETADEQQSGRDGSREMTVPVRGEVCYSGVCFSYGTSGRAALRAISFHAAPGEVVALVGPTGCGKSTLVNLLPAFYRPNAGQITIDGQDIAEIGIDSLRAAIGIVTQEVFLFNGTIQENIAFARTDATASEVVAACRAANCHDFISALPEGYASLVGERGVRLSGGEKQRISIARALLKDAPILILDEATASVDIATEHLIQEALGRLIARRTTLVVAHRVATVRHANQILVMRDGEIIARGNHETLMASNDLYRALCDVEDGGFLHDSHPIPSPGILS